MADPYLADGRCLCTCGTQLLRRSLLARRLPTRPEPYRFSHTVRRTTERHGASRRFFDGAFVDSNDSADELSRRIPHDSSRTPRGRAADTPRAGHRRAVLRSGAPGCRHRPQQPGSVASATNRLAEAEPLIRRALAIDEQSYGAEHPDVARDLNNLALLLKATNRLAEAEPLMRRALAIDEQSYGAEHPDVARDLNNLALLLKATNRLAEAEPLMARVVTIF